MTIPNSPAGVTYRLGIDRTQAECRGSVVLYCLAQNVNAQAQLSGDEYSLGPFIVQIHAPAGYVAKSKAARGFPEWKGVAVLFMETIPLEQTGTYAITMRPFSDSKNNIGSVPLPDIASTNVEVSGTSRLSSYKPMNASWLSDSLLMVSGVVSASISARGSCSNALTLTTCRIW